MASILTTVRDLERLRQIVGVLARHGFGEVVTRTGLGSLLGGGPAAAEAAKKRVGERIRLVLQDLGPSFIKLGQIVSTRPDLVPADIIVELKKLQDDVPAEPFEVIKTAIEADLGGSLEEIFESFEPATLASASIGQVHRARLRHEEASVDVVVKVQRPNVRQTIERDVDLLYWLAHAIERSIPEAKRYNPVKLVGEFDRAITAELDYGEEADNAERFARNFERKKIVVFPKVYREASSKRVLTLEYLPGRKLPQAIEEGFKGETLAKAAIDVIIQQVFEDGFFHADPHPGNVLILGTPDAPVIGMIDLGMVGRLTPQMRDRIIDLMVAAAREDYRGVADALYAVGRPKGRIDRQAYEAEVTMLAQKYLGKQLQDIHSSALIRDLVYGANKYDIEIPPDFLMFGKAMMTVEGIGKEIYPQLDLFEEIKPYFVRLMRQRYSPERITQDVTRAVVRLSGAATELPLQLQEILHDLREGSLQIQVHERHVAHAAERMGRRIFGGLVLGSLLVSGAILAAANQMVIAGVAAGLAAAYALGLGSRLFFLQRSQRRQK